MLSLYRERRSWLHGVPAGFKLLLLTGVGTALFATQRAAVVWPVAALCGAVFASLSPVGPALRRGARATFVAAALVAAFHALLGRALAGLTDAARLCGMALLGMAVTLSTRHAEWLDLLERLLAPLARTGLRVDRLGLQLALMLRFVDHFFAHWQRLDEAHRLRGGRAGGWRLAAPLTIQMLQVARRVADALHLRTGE